MRRFVVRKEDLEALLDSFSDTDFFNMEKEFEFDFRLVVKKDYFRVDKRFSFEDKWYCYLISKYSLRTGGHYTTSAVCEIVQKEDADYLLTVRFVTGTYYLFRNNFITHFDKVIENDILAHIQKDLPYLEEIGEGG